MTELEKYVEAYKDPTYKMCASRMQQAAAFLAQMQRGTMCDVGCGRGEVVRLAGTLGYQVKGYETVPYLCDNHNVFQGQLPFIPGIYDIVTCFDVLEHIEPGITEASLDNLREITKVQALIVISSVDDEPTNGMKLHINIRTPDEWLELLRSRFRRVDMFETNTSYGPTPFWCLV